MRRLLLVAGLAVLVATGGAAIAQRNAAAFDDPEQTREALAQANAGREAAERRAAELERQAGEAETAAERAAQQSAAVAARIQQAEASIAAAEARAALVERERTRLREILGREQQPMMNLTAALQQFTRRPALLAVFRPGEVKDVVYVRAVLSATVPEVQKRTAGLRARLQRQRQLREQAREAALALRHEQEVLGERQAELARLEATRRLEARQAGSLASREADRALALAEEAYDLDALVEELDRAGGLRERLAALPGPILRPARPSEAETIPVQVASPPGAASADAPRPYVLPVTGRTITGFGAPIEGGLSKGLTLAPRSGAQVVAPARGRVAFAGPYRGFGQIVIIEHEGGWTSLVTGLARIGVTVGDSLVGGAPLGTAAAGNPVVTLELRRDGEPVNPLEQVG